LYKLRKLFDITINSIEIFNNLRIIPVDYCENVNVAKVDISLESSD